MLILIGELNGQKIEIPVTADTGTGAPVGSFIYMYKKSNPSGYLYCDGSTFDQTKYPALYQYLGSNVLPDYRECVAVGAEQNTTDTIASHDVYTEGQFKDDQAQKITGNFRGWGFSSGAFADLGHAVQTVQTTGGDGIVENQYFDSSRNTRAGDTTHGKQKAVYIYIKATSGLTENQQENVLNTINENLSYSTTEHKTGKKWIDGKDIWSKTIYSTTGYANDVTILDDSNIAKITKVEHYASDIAGLIYQSPYNDGSGNFSYLLIGSNTLKTRKGGIFLNSNFPTHTIVEYTKTTDN